MSVSSLCTRCGFQNQPGYQFCTNCGAPLGAAPQAPAPAPVPAGYAPAAAYSAYPGSAEYERGKRVDRTRMGILLILLGTLLSWVPFEIDLIGYVLIFVGLILLLLRRKAFGDHHPRNTVLSIVLLFVGVGAIIGAALPLGISFATAQLTNTPISAAELSSDFQILLVGEIVGAIAFGLMSVLFTYALQKPMGRLLLLAGFGASVALSVAIYAIVSPVVQSAIQEALAGGTIDAATIAALEGIAGSYGLLNAIPSVLFASAEYLAWSRIAHGEIPPRPSSPAGPSPPFAAPAAPPQVPPPSGPPPPATPP